jgi:hypothetical protein
MIDSLWQALREQRSVGEQAWEVVRELHSRDRWSTFPQYNESSAWCAETLRELGVAQVERVAFPADGKSKFADWMMPLAWDVKDATLELIAPAPQVLARYREHPQSLVMWSAPTPPGGTEGELIVLEKGTRAEVEQTDVRGKIVFTPRHPTDIKALVAQRGGIGIVSDWMKAKDLPHERQWINTWSDAPGGWAMHAHDAPLWGFMLSPHEGERLRQETARVGRNAPTLLRARVDSRLYDGELHYVTGIVPGASEPSSPLPQHGRGAGGEGEEVLLMAHINEQGANDNASGAATVLTTAGILCRLITQGTLPPPRCTIRFLLMPESYGAIAYAAQNSRGEAICFAPTRTRVALNVDGGAGDYDHEDSALEIFVNPHCCLNFADAALVGLARDYYAQQKRPDKWKVKRYTLAGDNFFCDPLIGAPHPWLEMGDGGDFWHNSADTPDKVDPRSLRDLSTIVAAFVYFMAQAEEEDIRAYARETRATLPEPDRSLLRFPDDAAMPLDVRSFAGHALVPCRTLIGALTLDGVPLEKWRRITSSPRWWSARLAAWWWADGTRSLGEIAALIEREFGSPLDDAVEFFQWLEGLGYVSMKGESR